MSRLISAASARICGLAKPPNTARGAATAFGSKAQQLNILFLTNAHNGLSQRAKGVLEAQGHSVNVELALTQSQIKDVTADANPDVIICPFLTARVPEEIWRKGYPKPDVPVVIVHPGVQGDKGMSSIEWALKEGKPLGVTCLSAVEEMDAGPVWSTRVVPIARADPNTITKSSVYKNEITEAAVSAIQETIDKISAGLLPLEVDNADPATLGMLRPTMPEEDRAVDLTLDAQAVARQIRFSDGSPGAPVELCGKKFRAFGAIADVAETVPVPADVPPGTILGCRDGAVAVATGDGVVFISHLKCAKPTISSRGAIKVPAATALQDHSIAELPPLSLHYSSSSNAGRKWFLPPVDTYMDLWTQTTDGVCYVVANFLNGAMSTTQGKRLEALLKEVGERSDVDAVVFAGGYDAFANGINLNEIEVSNLGLPSPRGESWLDLESWRNINAINDVIKELFTMTDKVTISALRGGAGAGGFMAALATDRVWAHSGVVVNPHYRTMGLHGSEYWTHFLPERVGSMEAALRITEGKQAYTAQKAVEMNLIDKVLEANVEKFQQVLHANVVQLVREEKQSILLQKAQKFTAEYVGKLEAARAFELSVMKSDFVSREYNEARRRFVLKQKALATPVHLTNRMGTRMDGRLLAKRLHKKIGAEFAAQLARMPEGTTPPGLGIIQVGSLEDSTMYTNMKVKAAQSMGFTGILKQFDAVEDSYEAVRDQILAWNADPSIDGIMVQKPIPLGRNADTLLKLIDADKDIDCLNPENFHTFIENTSEAFIEGSSKMQSFMPPCPLGIMEMLNAYQVPLKGKAATVIGTSSNLGLPVALLLVNEGCSVTTVNMQSVSMLKESLENADIVIAAANSPNLVTPDMIKRGVVIVDAGICKDPVTAKLCGAVATECGALSKLISPVPGGVGPMTVAMLLNNLWRSWKYKHGITA